MSDKSSDTEDWTFVDKDGELELTDEGSSASSIEVVNVENDVVTYQNRRSLERSISPTLQNRCTVEKENGKCSEECQAAESNQCFTSLENQEDIVTKGSLDSNSDADIGDHEKVDCSKQKLSPMNSFAGDQPQIQREMSVSSDTSNVPSIQSIPSDLSDNSSDADSDYIRLESESLDGDNLLMTSSSVSSNFNFISRENSASTEDSAGDKIAVAKGSNEELEESSNLSSDKSIHQEPSKSINQEPYESFNQEADKGINHEPGLNGNQEFEDDNQNPAVSNNQLLEADNQNLADIDDRLYNGIQNLVVDNQVLEADNQNPVEMDDGLGVDVQHQLVDNQELEDNNNLENEDLSDMEHHDQSAEVEEDQDRNTDSGTEDDRIESDQSDTGSIPPLDDDMSFVNDIGDLPLVAGDVPRQYVHNPNRDLNLILDVIAILMFAVVLGLGIGHAIATFDEIEEYETLHSNIVSLRSQALTCQNQKWSQKLTINDLRVDQQSLNMKYEESKAEQEKLRIKNALLIMELEAFRKLETSADSDNVIRLKLQNEINQLKIEKEELKQMIGRLKYTTHPANKNIGNTDNAKFNNELCDKSASDTKAALKYHGKRLSDYSLDDLQEIHNSESLDNSLLKQEVGRLRYTSHPSNHVTEMESSEDKVTIETEHQNITQDFKCENVTALKEELDHAQRYAEICQQIKDTWLQVKNLSHQFWAQHEGKVTKTLTKFTNKVVNIGKRLQDKLQRKVSRWYKKDKGKQQKNKESSEGKARRDKGHDRKRIKKSKSNAKHLKHQAKQERKFQKRAVIKEKKKQKSEKKLKKTISKFLYKMSNKMNYDVFKKLDEKARQSVLNRIYHIQHFATELGFYSDKHQSNSNINNYLDLLNCQDQWWSSVVVKDLPTDSQILHCSQFLPDWQMKKLLIRRRTMLIEGKLEMSNEMTVKKIGEIQKKFGIYDGNEKGHQVKEGTHSDDTYVRSRKTTDDSGVWQFQRAQDREEVRKRESGPDWLFERANRRKESREEESEPDWLFERAKHRKDLRYKEWEEPEWTFKRAKHREEVREEKHQPDWIFDRAHEREKIRDQSSRSPRRQRHVAHMVDCL
ncbi:hypothetical protein LOTGIDRAFT_235292 [Lottia gigantea]|uniref:Uncharacterized protein n=1 Tax=Lottia gigantea TaxID=225164 RepID=V3Z763_LOTGI|nr:hypothetical protein LOTGIDRAFT_235292 [Lottia gigantea]ESO86688.1 hypothetical protein LOTGIDRAFT_235292 [Lottia gigantea]